MELLDQILAKENLNKAYLQVFRNKGAWDKIKVFVFDTNFTNLNALTRSVIFVSGQ